MNTNFGLIQHFTLFRVYWIKMTKTWQYIQIYMPIVFLSNVPWDTFTMGWPAARCNEIWTENRTTCKMTSLIPAIWKKLIWSCNMLNGIRLKNEIVHNIVVEAWFDSYYKLLWHVNPEVAGSSPALVNYSLFIQIYLKSVPSQFPLWFITK